MSATMELDLSEIPVMSALRDRTRRLLELSLNRLKVIFTDETNIPRDWRGVAHLAGINVIELTQSANPFAEVLTLWDEEKMAKGETRPSIRDLQDILVQIDRWDVYDDTEEIMMGDAEHYIASRHTQPALEDTIQPFQNGCLTTKDVDRIRSGLPLFKYDAFVLYADEDEHYARVMIETLESDYNLNLVVKDRDLLGGVGFEFKAITKLIAERCASLIVILSPNLLKSDAHMFFLAFAQSIGISQGQKRIIPCIYEPCVLPAEISYLYRLDYKQSLRFGNFWQRIKTSVQLASIEVSSPARALLPAQGSSENRCVITEVETEDIHSPVESTVTEQTAIVKMSDPSTHFLGNSIEDSSENKWFTNRPPSNVNGEMKSTRSFFSHFKKTKSKANEDLSCDSTKVEPKSNILNAIRKKKNKLFTKKKAVACEA